MSVATGVLGVRGTELPTSPPSRPGRWLKIVALVSAAIGVVVFAGSQRATAQSAVAVLSDARLGWLALLMSLAGAGLLVGGGLLRAGQAVVGNRIGPRESVWLAAAIHAANVVVRAGGAAGLGVLIAARRQTASPGALSAAYCLGRQVAHLVFAALVLGAVCLLAIDGRMSWLVAAGTAVFLVSRVVKIGGLWFAATHPHLLPRWKRLDPVRAHVPAFTDGLRAAAEHPWRVARVGAWAALLDLVRVGWLWASLHAVGAPTSVELTLEAYGTVALLGPLSILPAGLGVMDAGLVATFHHAGIGVAAATAGVVLFRVAELWVPLIAGAKTALRTSYRAAGSTAG